MSRYLARIYIKEGQEFKKVTLTLRRYKNLLYRVGYLLDELKPRTIRRIGNKRSEGNDKEEVNV